MIQICLLLLCLPVPASTSITQEINYRLDLRLEPAAHLIEGTATIEFSGTGSPSGLRLAPGAEVIGVASSGHSIPFTFRGGNLNFPTSARDLRQLTICYRAIFDDRLPQELAGIEDPSFGIGATILNEGIYLSSGTDWFPRAPGIAGRHQLRIAAPKGMIAVTAGRFLGNHEESDMTISEWRNDFPLDGLALAAGYYRVADDNLDGIQLLTFLSPDNADLAPAYLAAMRRHLAFYRERLGPYPFDKFAVVENFLPTGYGMPSWTLLGTSVIRLPFLFDSSLPHEIVHSWWGNAIEVDYSDGNWCEGLTTYLADYLLKERSSPQEALDYRRKLLRDYQSLVVPETDFPLSAFTSRTSRPGQAIGYGKAAMLFHMLRRDIGDDTFWKALRNMAEHGLGSKIGWRDIEKIFSKTAGRDLRAFFQQWVERSGAPELTFDGLRVTRSGGNWLVSGTIRQRAESYQLDFPLRLITASGAPIEQVVHLAGSRTPFAFSTNTRANRVEGDPDCQLFRRLAPEEVPASVNDLLTPRQPLVVVATGHDDLLASARDLLRGLHWEEAPAIAEKLVSADMLKGRDVLLIGWPSRKELRPPLPAGLTISAGKSPVWQFTDNTSGSDTLFAVLSRRLKENGVRAVLLADNQQAVRMASTKIPHYGRYSLLLFAQGRNLAKATWEPSTSPLSVPLDKEP